MHRGGLCVSYDRLSTFSTDVTHSIIMHWEQISVAVPHQDNRGVSLQVGLIISITTHHRPQQHLPSMEHTYAFNSIFRLNTSKVKKIHKILDPVERDKKHVKYLPACYRTMDLDITLSHDCISFLFLSISVIHIQFPNLSPKTSIEDGYHWLDDVNKLVEKDNLEDR